MTEFEEEDILTYSPLPDNTTGFFDAWRPSCSGASLPHGCCLAGLVSAPAFGERTIHNLPLALWTNTWSINGVVIYFAVHKVTQYHTQ